MQTPINLKPIRTAREPGRRAVCLATGLGENVHHSLVEVHRALYLPTANQATMSAPACPLTVKERGVPAAITVDGNGLDFGHPPSVEWNAHPSQVARQEKASVLLTWIASYTGVSAAPPVRRRVSATAQ